MTQNKSHITTEQSRIAVIGLGYVGLPLAAAFAKIHMVLGFDIDAQRINNLKQGMDCTTGIDSETFAAIASGNRTDGGLIFSNNANDLLSYNTFIITVPTPVDVFRAPDLTRLLQASKMVGAVLKPGDLVIYESTVYPGCTEEDCIPVLENVSGLRLNHDFFVGYSPERINPGDNERKLADIVKVTSGSTPEIADRVDALYRSIITAGTYKAPSIKVAEAAKAIENAQRDVNISFVNELALIFDRLDIDTQEVLDAARTKWNFIPFQPGLVGGHCIGVDPYYLAHKAEQVGYLPNVILSGRRINEQMGAFVANKVVKLMLQKDIPLKGAKALLMGITFKENCSDVRNSRVVDIYRELQQFGLKVDVYDPLADGTEVEREYGIITKNLLETQGDYDAVVVAVAHHSFLTIDFAKVKKDKGVLFDVKGILDRSLVDARL